MLYLGSQHPRRQYSSKVKNVEGDDKTVANVDVKVYKFESGFGSFAHTSKYSEESLGTSLPESKESLAVCQDSALFLS